MPTTPLLTIARETLPCTFLTPPPTQLEELNSLMILAFVNSEGGKRTETLISLKEYKTRMWAVSNLMSLSLFNVDTCANNSECGSHELSFSLTASLRRDLFGR